MPPSNRERSTFCAYHAVPTNFRALLAFRTQIKRLRALRRRSQKDRTSWERITKLADDFLPPPRILHPGARADRLYSSRPQRYGLLLFRDWEEERLMDVEAARNS